MIDEYGGVMVIGRSIPKCAGTDLHQYYFFIAHVAHGLNLNGNRAYTLLG